MTLPELGLGLLVLLLTPGPTNTLMLLAGHERGLTRALPLIPVEGAAYLAVILPLSQLSQALAGWLPSLMPLVATAAGIWVAWLALGLWRSAPHSAQTGGVTATTVAVTTLANPKGLIIGLVLLPAAGATAPAFGTLLLCIALVAGLYTALGAGLTGRAAGARLSGGLRRLAAFWLAGLSVFLVAGGVAA